jgi:hypothetical protein
LKATSPLGEKDIIVFFKWYDPQVCRMEYLGCHIVNQVIASSPPDKWNWSWLHLCL